MPRCLGIGRCPATPQGVRPDQQTERWIIAVAPGASAIGEPDIFDDTCWLRVPENRNADRFDMPMSADHAVERIRLRSRPSGQIEPAGDRLLITIELFEQ